MHKMIVRIAGLIALFVVLYVAFGLVSSVSQLATVVEQWAPGWGRPFFLATCVALLAIAVTPVILYFRLPQPLVPPETNTGPEHDAFIKALRARLAANPALAGDPLETDADLTAAMQKLGAQADKLVQQHASTVFVSTAVMQNGRLDGLIVLLTQIRMVWLIANLFFQRPSPRQMLYLYGNVGTNVILAQNIQEIEFTELAAPLVFSIFPSLNGAIPGMQGITNLMLNSLANGSANAFLTLRVGIIARMYCESTCAPASAQVRTSATRKSLELLGRITREHGSAIASGALNLVGKKLGAALDGAKSAGGAVAKGAVSAGGAVAKGAVSAGGAVAKGAVSATGAVAKGAVCAGGAIVGGASTAGGAIVKGAAAVGGAIADGATSAGGAVVRGAASAGGAVVRGATSAGVAIVDGASTVGGAIVGGANTVGGAIVGGASTVGGAIVGGASTVGGAIAKGAKVVTGRNATPDVSAQRPAGGER